MNALVIGPAVTALLVATAATPGCARPAPTFREQLAAYDIAQRDAARGSEGRLNQLDAQLVDETRADPQATIKLYQGDPEWWVRVDCALFLASARVKDAAPLLAAGVKSDPDRRVEDISVGCLFRLLNAFGSDEVVRAQALAGAHIALGKESPVAVFHAARIVARIKSPSSLGVLSAALPRVKPTSWKYVVDAIHEIGGLEATAALRRIRKTTKDAELRAHIDGLLKS